MELRLDDGAPHVERRRRRAGGVGAVVVHVRLPGQARILERATRLLGDGGGVPVDDSGAGISRVGVATEPAVPGADEGRAGSRGGGVIEPIRRFGRGGVRTPEGDGEAHGGRLRLSVRAEKVRHLFVHVRGEELAQGVQRARLLELDDAGVCDDDEFAARRDVLRGEFASKTTRRERQIGRGAVGEGRREVAHHAGRGGNLAHGTDAGRRASRELLRGDRLAKAPARAAAQPRTRDVPAHAPGTARARDVRGSHLQMTRKGQIARGHEQTSVLVAIGGVGQKHQTVAVIRSLNLERTRRRRRAKRLRGRHAALRGTLRERLATRHDGQTRRRGHETTRAVRTRRAAAARGGGRVSAVGVRRRRRRRRRAGHSGVAHALRPRGERAVKYTLRPSAHTATSVTVVDSAGETSAMCTSRRPRWERLAAAAPPLDPPALNPP